MYRLKGDEEVIDKVSKCLSKMSQFVNTDKEVLRIMCSPFENKQMTGDLTCASLEMKL